MMALKSPALENAQSQYKQLVKYLLYIKNPRK